MRRLLTSRVMLAPSLAIPALLVSSGARADESTQVTVHEFDPKTGQAAVPIEHRLDYLDLGPILSLVGGFHHATGIGFEASWMTYQSGRMPSFGYGPFLQAQLYDGKYARVAAGMQGAAGPAGVELGLAFRQTDGTYASSVGVHAAVFLSIGYLFLAIRGTTQVVAFPTDQASFGFETAFTIGLKVPITIVGRDPTGYAVQANGHAW